MEAKPAPCGTRSDRDFDPVAFRVENEGFLVYIPNPARAIDDGVPPASKRAVPVGGVLVLDTHTRQSGGRVPFFGCAGLIVPKAKTR